MTNAHHVFIVATGPFNTTQMEHGVPLREPFAAQTTTAHIKQVFKTRSLDRTSCFPFPASRFSSILQFLLFS
jgi:hypothetical protein